LTDCNDSDCAGPACCTDSDGDGYAIEGGACGPVDCDDGDASIHPGVSELCNGVDDDCDGFVDEGCGPVGPAGGGPTVGGVAFPVNKFALVTPWLFSGVLLAVLIMFSILLRREKKTNISR
jgi:hypothetical protein